MLSSQVTHTRGKPSASNLGGLQWQDEAQRPFPAGRPRRAKPTIRQPTHATLHSPELHAAVSQFFQFNNGCQSTDQRYGGHSGGFSSRRRWSSVPGPRLERFRKGPARHDLREVAWATHRRIWAKCTRRIEWRLPEERGACSEANRPDSVGAAPGIHPVESHLLEHHTPRPGENKLDFDTGGSAALPAIACSGVISAANCKHWVDSRLTANGLRSGEHRSRSVPGCREREETFSALPNGKHWVQAQAFDPARQDRPCRETLGDYLGRIATSTNVPPALPVIGQYFNDIPSFQHVCTTAPSLLCLCSASTTHPNRPSLLGKLLLRQGRISSSMRPRFVDGSRRGYLCGWRRLGG